METLTDRIARLEITEISEARMETLTIAHAANVSDVVFKTLSSATRVARKPTIMLPAHRFEGLSRGKGWARLGGGANVTWGERTAGGYRVGAGRWTVGGNDGFSRKGEVVWDVAHVTVAGETWTVAV